MTNPTEQQTIYIGPTADDVRRILRDAGIEPYMIGEDDAGKPTVELSEGRVTLPMATLINAYMKAVMERDAYKMIAESHMSGAHDD